LHFLRNKIWLQSHVTDWLVASKCGHGCGSIWLLRNTHPLLDSEGSEAKKKKPHELIGPVKAWWQCVWPSRLVYVRVFDALHA
jgi:hypothetical protein